MSLGGFCKTPLWDLNVTWYTENPQLTPCFEFTVLTWIPFLVLVVCLPFKMRSSLGPKVRPYPMTLLTHAKYFLTAYLCLIYGVGIYADYSPETANSELTAFVMQTAGCFVAFLYQIVDQKRARRTSDVLFTYWTLSMICAFPGYYRMVRSTFSTLSAVVPSGFHYTVNMIAFPAICCLVVLYSFTERDIGDTRKPCPLDIASLPSSVSFEWFTPLIVTGFRKTLTVGDLFAVSQKLKTTNNYTRWLCKNNETVEGERLTWSLFRTYWLIIIATCSMMMCFTIFRTLPPVLLTLIIRYVSSEQETWKGYFYGACILVASKTGMTLLRHCDFHFVLLGLQIKGILVNAVYRKTLLIATASLSKYTIGEIINLITVDADKPYQTSLMMGQGLTAVFMTMTVTIWLSFFVGPSALAVPVVTLFLVPLTAVLTRICSRLQNELMALKDRRLMCAGEALGNIRILKFYAWEVPFLERILGLRDQEVTALKMYTTLAAFMRLFWFTLPFMQSLAVLSIYMISNGLTTLDIETGFVTITLCSMLRQSLAVCPDVISNLIQTRVALQRIGEFLDAEEKDSELVGNDPGPGVAVRIDGASLAWSTTPDDPPLLKNINLTVNKGQLLGIFGLVGAGKSSLLQAMLGEMRLIEGTIDIDGSVAYVPQRAWIIHGTIRKNITFMNEYEKYFYRRVADKCCLKSDFDMLMDGDRTEIGEKGVNLSGGQRQRISLARAVYLDKDVYLLDDPLSAVDAQVGSKIFSKVLGPRGMLREKTRIFVTNNLSLLKLVDVVVFMQDGVISDYGTFRELMAKEGDFAKVVTEHSKKPVEEDRRDSGGALARVLSLLSESAVEYTVTASGTVKAHALVAAEVAQVGSIQRHVYTNYIKHMGGIFLLLAFTGYIVCRVFDVGAGLWIGSWSRDAELPKEEQTVARRTTRIVVFGIVGLFMGMFAFLGTSMLSVGAVRAAKTLHEEMLGCLFEAPMSFFDTTPLGRILNRVSKDVDQLDIQLPMMANMFFELFFQLLALIILISVILPAFLIAAVPLTLLYMFLRKLYLKTLRQLKRLEAITRSPVVNSFAETLDGLSSIRSYGAEKLFIEGFLKEVDKTQNCSFFLLISKLWMISRLDLIGCVMVLIVSCLVVYWRGQIAPGTAGVILSYMLTSTFAFNNLVHFAAEAEAAIVSSERVEEYTKIESEAPRRVDPSPPKDWPQKGAITFVNFSARYRDGLGMCIRDVNLDFEAAEKVAIVGRTGAGKSTMTLVLFRILEAAKGCILIDNVDISKVGLHDLRSKLTIIPQDAVLFSGTLRMNLDPDDDFEDSELWSVLERTNLKGRFPEGLESAISEGGHNMSVGQRQLVCLARAVLKSTKILILDEATAAVDVDTDALIQRTIRTVFRDSTVITIAHRLNTILDSDKIVVMADGEVIEVGSPIKLLDDPSTEFYSMAKESGIV